MEPQVQLLIPFGKYKGQPLDVLQHDPQYVEWMRGQSWLSQRYPTFHTLIINNFQEPDETPAHNTVQALFLDEAFQYRVFLLCMAHIPAIYEDIEDCAGKTIPQRFVLTVQFEVRGIDVVLEGRCETPYTEGEFADRWHPFRHFVLAIEIKPSLGDDYPAVLRQVTPYRDCAIRPAWQTFPVVLIQDFCASGATFEQVRKIYALSQIPLLTLADVEMMRNALQEESPLL